MVECKNGGFFRTSFLSQTFLTYRGRNLSKSENPDLEGSYSIVMGVKLSPHKFYFIFLNHNILCYYKCATTIYSILYLTISKRGWYNLNKNKEV